MKTKAIFGYGGFASEVYAFLRVKFPDGVHFVHADYYVKGNSKLCSIENHRQKICDKLIRYTEVWQNV